MPFCVMESPVGRLRIAEEEGYVTRIDRTAEAPAPPPTPLLTETVRQLTAYFDGSLTAFDLPLRTSGTAFQEQCWAALREIPYGTITSYGEQARRIGHPKAARAVGGANHDNPIMIVIPCHRVVGAGGKLTGYGGGLDMKAWLLEHERAVLAAQKPQREAYVDRNAEVWDRINECLTDKATAISHEDFLAARNGALHIVPAGVRSVPREWFPPLEGADVLALASGGGQQAPVFAAHGARVTVTDVSARQLENERLVAEREGYEINIIEADMSQPFPFADAAFDLIFNPVSNCYIRDILPMWRECARVIRPGGVLITAFVKEEHFLFEPDFRNEDVLISRHPLPFDPTRDLTEAQRQATLDGGMPLAFSHTLTEQLGGLMQAGFVLTDLFEDGDGGGLFDRWMQSYVVVRAVRRA